MFAKSRYLFLVLFIEGAALMAVELMGAKLVAPFYGSSLYVWTSVLAITVLGLTCGYYLGGHLSRKLRSEKPLVFILGVSALLVGALPHTAAVLISLTKTLNLIAGISVTSVFLILPTMICFGMVGPTVVRLMTARLETVGSTAGMTYFVSTSGGILATFLFGYYLIPETGLKFSAIVTALSLASLVVVYILLVVFSGKLSNSLIDPIKNVSAQSETRIAGAGSVKTSVYLFAVLEGAVVMAVELIAARMIAPYFGSSLYVWSAVIGFTLFGLALGYFFGGKLADKYTHLRTILWVLLGASIFIMLMHLTSEQLTAILINTNMSLAAIIVSLFLVVPPLLFLGMVPVLLIRFITAQVDNSGKTTGNVFTISSASGILALLGMGFYVIPHYGLTVPSIVIGMIVGIIPLLKLVEQKQYIALLFLVAVFGSFLTKSGVRSSSDVDVKYFSEGLLGQVLVTDVQRSSNEVQEILRLLFVNRFGESFINDKGNSAAEYNYYVSSIASKLPEDSDMLILGLGGGAVANMAYNGLKFNVDVVEFDRRMADVARQYFALNNNVHIVIDDARHYLEKTSNKYDLIFFDVFRGDIPPAHVYSVESFKKAKSLLNKDGFIIVNFFGFVEGASGKAARSVYKTIRAAGLDTKIVLTAGPEDARNILFIASKKPQTFDRLRFPLKNAEGEIPLDTFLVNTDEIDLAKEDILTDDKPLMDRLSLVPTSIWRKNFNERYTQLFLDKGVPLFR